MKAKFCLLALAGVMLAGCGGNNATTSVIIGSSVTPVPTRLILLTPLPEAPPSLLLIWYLCGAILSRVSPLRK